MTSARRRIGFADFKLGNFHADRYLSILRNELEHRGYKVTACTAMRAEPAREWAEANGVPFYADPEEMNRLVDHYMILAPSNPELHRPLCEKVLPFGKATYVDKTFAPDLKTAKAIFRLADRHRAPLQTTSALRYSNVQEAIQQLGGPAAIRHMVAWGDGGSFAEYAIHPVELLISCMGPKAKRHMRRGTGRESQLLVDFAGGRTAVANVYVGGATPYAASVTTAEVTRLMQVDTSKIFVNTAAAILDFFDSGRPNIDRNETLTIRRILDLAAEKRALREFVTL